jgi:hypothetical protein
MVVILSNVKQDYNCFFVIFQYIEQVDDNEVFSDEHTDEVFFVVYALMQRDKTHILLKYTVTL